MEEWETCPTHGQTPNAWGCPECVREMRQEIQALRVGVMVFRDDADKARSLLQKVLKSRRNWLRAALHMRARWMREGRC